jgi:hypothetical protein
LLAWLEMPPVKIALNSARSESSAIMGFTTPVEIHPHPAHSESSASAEIKTQVEIHPDPARSESSASIELEVVVQSLLLAYVATVATVRELPHDPHQKPAEIFDPLTLTPALTVVALLLLTRKIARNLQRPSEGM